MPHLRMRGVEEWVVGRRLGGKMVIMLTLVLRKMMMRMFRKMMLRMLRMLRTWMLILMGKVSRWCH